MAPLTEISNSSSVVIGKAKVSQLNSNSKAKSNGSVSKIHNKAQRKVAPLTRISNSVAAFAHTCHLLRPKPQETVTETSIDQKSNTETSKKESCNHRKNQTLPTRLSSPKNEDTDICIVAVDTIDWGLYLCQPLKGSLVYKDVPFFESVDNQKNLTQCNLCEFSFETSRNHSSGHCGGKHHQVAYQLLETFESIRSSNSKVLKARVDDCLVLRSRISALPKAHRTEMNKILVGHLQNTNYKKWSAVLTRLVYFEMENTTERTLTPTFSSGKKVGAKKQEATKKKVGATDKENQKTDSKTKTVMRPSGKAFCAEKQAAEAIASFKKKTSIQVTENPISLHNNIKSVVSDDDEDDLLFSPFSNDGDGDNAFFSNFSTLIAVQQHFRAPVASPYDDNEELEEIDDAITQTLLGINFLDMADDDNNNNLDDYSLDEDDTSQLHHEFSFSEVVDWQDDHSRALLCSNNNNKESSLLTIPEVDEFSEVVEDWEDKYNLVLCNNINTNNEALPSIPKLDESIFNVAELSPVSVAAVETVVQVERIDEIIVKPITTTTPTALEEDVKPITTTPAAAEEDVAAALAVIEALAFFGL